MVRDLDQFMAESDVIIANRRTAELGRAGSAGGSSAAGTSSQGCVDWACIKETSRKRGDKECPICIVPLARSGRSKRLAWLSCSHVFHLDCIKAFEMFQDSQGMKRTCPVCRAEEYSRLPSTKVPRR